MNFLDISLIQSFIGIAIVIATDIIFEFFVFKKIRNNKKRARAKVTLRYVLFVTIIVILAKIWVEGFGHILAFIGFISAALTIAQKENILNLTGWLIISLRNSFGEGDYVQIGDHQGFVRMLGLFYFTLEEVDPKWGYKKTGKLVKLPNSIITLQPVVTFNNEDFIFHEETVILPFSVSYAHMRQIMITIELGLKEYLATIERAYNAEEKRLYDKLLKREKVSNPSLDIKFEQGEMKGYKLCIQFYSLIKDKKNISSYIRNTLLETIQASEQPLLT